jgi:hypothetical protein
VLRSFLRRYLTPQVLAGAEPGLRRLGGRAAGEMIELAREAEGAPPITLESSMRFIALSVKPQSPASYSCAAWRVATLAIMAMVAVDVFQLFLCSLSCLLN